MSKIKITEIFYSLQGEGLYVGQPSVFVRTFGCNFRCKGFGLREGEQTTEPLEVLEEYKKNPDWKFENLPLVSTGCDSYGAVYPQFKKLSPMMEVSAVIEKMETERQLGSTLSKNNGSTHLVITGGEPLLGWQRAYPDLIDAAFIAGYNNITFETNGTQELTNEFKEYLAARPKPSTITFSVSPKLPCSGETADEALKPEIVADYQTRGTVYLKFVVSNRDDMQHVERFIRKYKEAGWRGEVYLMPCGGVTSPYELNAPEVAELALRYGYRYSPRLQLDLYGNEWGT